MFDVDQALKCSILNVPTLPKIYEIPGFSSPNLPGIGIGSIIPGQGVFGK